MRLCIGSRRPGDAPARPERMPERERRARAPACDASATATPHTHARRAVGAGWRGSRWQVEVPRSLARRAAGAARSIPNSRAAPGPAGRARGRAHRSPHRANTVPRGAALDAALPRAKTSVLSPQSCSQSSRPIRQEQSRVAAWSCMQELQEIYTRGSKSNELGRYRSVRQERQVDSGPRLQPDM